MQRQNMIFIFFVAFLLIIFMGYLFVIGEQKDTKTDKKNGITSKVPKEEELGQCNFVKNYTLLLVTESDDEEYVFITRTEYQVDNVATVKVKKDIMPSLKTGNYYRFSFSTKKAIHDDIEEIFESSIIREVEDVKKVVDGENAICATHLLEN